MFLWTLFIHMRILCCAAVAMWCLRGQLSWAKAVSKTGGRGGGIRSLRNGPTAPGMGATFSVIDSFQLHKQKHFCVFRTSFCWNFISYQWKSYAEINSNLVLNNNKFVPPSPLIRTQRWDSISPFSKDIQYLWGYYHICFDILLYSTLWFIHTENPWLVYK